MTPRARFGPRSPGNWANQAASRSVRCRARAQGYASNATMVVNDRRAGIATEAAGAEQRGLLDPVTKQLVTRAQAATPIYVKWQRESSPLVAARSAQKSAAGWGLAAEILGGVAMTANAAAGNTTGVQESGQIMTEAANSVVVAEAHVAEIDQTLATTAQALVWHQGQPLSVRLFGKVYTFSGSLENQQGELPKGCSQ